MIIRIFRDNQPLILLLSLLISVLVWIRIGFNSHQTIDVSSLSYSSAFYFFPALNNIHKYQVFSVLLNIILVLFIGSYLSKIIIKYQLVPIRASLPMFMMVITTLPYFTKYAGFSFPLLSLLAFLSVIDILFGTTEDKGISYRFFDSSIILSLLSFINFYILIYIVFIIYALFQLRGFRLREVVFVLLGAVIPYIFLVAILYLTNGNISEWFNGLIGLFHSRFRSDYPILIYLIIVFSGVLYLLSSYRILRNYVKMKVVTRKYAQVFFGLFVMTVLMILFYPSLNIDYLFFLAIPIVFLFSYYFATCRLNLLNQILFALFIGLNLATLVF